MIDTQFTREEGPARPTVLRAPFQTPAIDRTPAVTTGTDAQDSGGVEANFAFGDILKTVANVLL
ncbi:hypothetical protein [Streptomyces sp. NPDC048002]|uniref:hypothetical protein n=1 Tax=Streptomyces sp. NPDC048002 TaxID=3154344 RepID=UPI0033CD0977